MARKEGAPMQEVRNLNDKRVGDISPDKKTYISKLKDCITKITANRDGTLNISHEPDKKVP